MTKISWKEFERKYGSGDGDTVHIFLDNGTALCFWQDGEITVSKHRQGMSCRISIAQDRTPEQMEQFLLSVKE